MKLMEGKPVADRVLDDVRARVVALKQKGGIPGLAVVIVGDDPASVSYVNSKDKMCRELGFNSWKVTLPGTATQEELVLQIRKLNSDPAVHGILVQSPLPEHLDENGIVELIDPAKDVDGFNPVNIGRLQLEEKAFIPCTPHGVIRMMEHFGISAEGKHAVVLGRSNIVGKPMAMLLLHKTRSCNATVTVCHSRTADIRAVTRTADILIAAIGKPGFVKKDFIKPGAVVIDVGINRIPDPSSAKGYRITGDVDFDDVKDVVSWITPVPGGVGKMTVAMLMLNVVEAAERAVSP